MDYPNMLPELIEAIQFTYKDEPEVKNDIYLYLSGLELDNDKVIQLSNRAEEELIQDECCPYCGTKMQYTRHKIYHDELEGCPVEVYTEQYCPKCDMP